MRLGWPVPPPRLLAALVESRHASDLGSLALPQLVLAHLLASGAYGRHLRTVRQRQRQRRDAVLAALAEHLPGARAQGVAAGLHLLVLLPDAGGRGGRRRGGSPRRGGRRGRAPDVVGTGTARGRLASSWGTPGAHRTGSARPCGASGTPCAGPDNAPPGRTPVLLRPSIDECSAFRVSRSTVGDDALFAWFCPDPAGVMQQRRPAMVHEDTLSSVLADFARTMITDFPIQKILNTLVERMVEVLAVSGAGVTLISPGLAPRYVAASDAAALQFEQLQTELGEGPCLLAYDSGEPVAVPDLSLDDQFPQFGPAALEAGMHAVFTFPLRHGEGRLGALDLYRDTPGMLNEREMTAAQILADVAAAYLINAQARQQALDVSDRFRVSALHDALTGLPNRALLGQRLEHLALRAQRSHATAAVLFVDLDKFKRVNDTHGHAVGDELLVAVAQRLEGVVRPGDTLARVAGDEFVILCEDLVEAGDAEILATRMQSELSRPFEMGAVTLGVSASVGDRLRRAGGSSINAQLLTDADTAMYQAKRRGGGVHQVIDLREAKEAADRGPPRGRSWAGRRTAVSSTWPTSPSCAPRRAASRRRGAAAVDAPRPGVPSRADRRERSPSRAT
jgi:diguanylate cyclase (GGDEF)-like protein